MTTMATTTSLSQMLMVLLSCFKSFIAVAFLLPSFPLRFSFSFCVRVVAVSLAFRSRFRALSLFFSHPLHFCFCPEGAHGSFLGVSHTSWFNVRGRAGQVLRFHSRFLFSFRFFFVFISFPLRSFPVRSFLVPCPLPFRFRPEGTHGSLVGVGHTSWFNVRGRVGLVLPFHFRFPSFPFPFPFPLRFPYFSCSFFTEWFLSFPVSFRCLLVGWW